MVPTPFVASNGATYAVAAFIRCPTTSKVLSNVARLQFSITATDPSHAGPPVLPPLAWLASLSDFECVVGWLAVGCWVIMVAVTPVAPPAQGERALAER